jgi:hypothetical protein
MPAVVANTNSDSRWRTWHALALLVAAHAVFNIISNPTSGHGEEFPTLLWVGIYLIQPVLFAAWIAMGPRPAIQRIPFSVAGFLLLLLASCVPQLLSSQNNFPPRGVGLEMLFMPATLFGAALISMFLLHIVFRWRIENTRPSQAGPTATNQFSIKYLLVLTAASAVMLAIGRALVSSMDVSDYPSWRDIVGLIARIWVIFLAMVPAIVVPIVALSSRPTFRMILGTIASSGVLALVAIETIILLDAPSRSNVTRQVVLVQLGAVLASFASALVLRFAGYRLVRQSKLAAPTNHQVVI